jgi:hypothetical protein
VAHSEAIDYKVELVKKLMKEVRFEPIIHKWLQKRHILKGEISIGQNMNSDGCPNSKQVGCTVGDHIAVYLYEKYLKDFEEHKQELKHHFTD